MKTLVRNPKPVDEIAMDKLVWSSIVGYVATKELMVFFRLSGKWIVVNMNAGTGQIIGLEMENGSTIQQAIAAWERRYDDKTTFLVFDSMADMHRYALSL